MMIQVFHQMRHAIIIPCMKAVAHLIIAACHLKRCWQNQYQSLLGMVKVSAAPPFIWPLVATWIKSRFHPAFTESKLGLRHLFIPAAQSTNDTPLHQKVEGVACLMMVDFCLEAMLAPGISLRYLRMQQILLNGDMVSTALSDSKKKECWILETIHNQHIFLSLKEKVWNGGWAVFFYSNIESGFCKGIVIVSGLSDFMNTIQFLVIWGCKKKVSWLVFQLCLNQLYARPFCIYQSQI